MFVSVKKFPSLTLQHSQLRMDTDSGCNTLSAASGQIQKTLSAASRQTQKTLSAALRQTQETFTAASRKTQKHSQLLLGKHKTHISCFKANTKNILSCCVHSLQLSILQFPPFSSSSFLPRSSMQGSSSYRWEYTGRTSCLVESLVMSK